MFSIKGASWSSGSFSTSSEFHNISVVLHPKWLKVYRHIFTVYIWTCKVSASCLLYFRTFINKIKNCILGQVNFFRSPSRSRGMQLRSFGQAVVKYFLSRLIFGASIFNTALCSGNHFIAAIIFLLSKIVPSPQVIQQRLLNSICLPSKKSQIFIK